MLVWTATDFVLSFLRAPNGCVGEGNRSYSIVVVNGSDSFLAANSFNLGPIPSCVAILRSCRILSKARKRISIDRLAADVPEEL